MGSDGRAVSNTLHPAAAQCAPDCNTRVREHHSEPGFARGARSQTRYSGCSPLAGYRCGGSLPAAYHSAPSRLVPLGAPCSRLVHFDALVSVMHAVRRPSGAAHHAWQGIKGASRRNLEAKCRAYCSALACQVPGEIFLLLQALSGAEPAAWPVLLLASPHPACNAVALGHLSKFSLWGAA